MWLVIGNPGSHRQTLPLRGLASIRPPPLDALHQLDLPGARAPCPGGKFQRTRRIEAIRVDALRTGTHRIPAKIYRPPATQGPRAEGLPTIRAGFRRPLAADSWPGTQASSSTAFDTTL